MLNLLKVSGAIQNSESVYSLKGGIPIDEQFNKGNTTYIIKGSIDLGWEAKNPLRCEEKVDIVRKESVVDCKENVQLGGLTYYCNQETIKVYWNESIIVPRNCVILSTDKKEILSENEYYSPGGSGRDILIGTRKKGEVKYKHCKVVYATKESLLLEKDNAIVLPAGCVLLTEDKTRVISYTSIYKAEQRFNCYVASLNVGDISYSYGKVVKVPEGCKLQFKCSGLLENGVIECENTIIEAGTHQIFKDVAILGTIKNNELIVEWFGCKTSNEGEVNQDVGERYVIPSALLTKSNIFHSKKGVYRFSNGYPLRNPFWGYDHEYIMDCNGIQVYGCGSKTIIQGMPRNGNNPADVFNLVDLKNLSIHDLAVTAIKGNGNLTYGTNAFSLIHNIENITVSNCAVYNMPYVLKKDYPDGGKAYTIQVGKGTNQKSIIIKDCYAKGVSYGLDYTKTQKKEGDIQSAIIFNNNIIEDAIVGCVLHQWDSPEGEKIEKISVRGNDFLNCQVGVVCQTCKGASILNNKVVNKKTIMTTDYYDGVYGFYLIGAYNIDIIGNEISLKECDSFIKASVYSYIPRYNGTVSGVSIKDNIISGRNMNYSIDVGSSATKSSEEQMYKGIVIEGNKVKTKTGRGLSQLGEHFSRE